MVLHCSQALIRACLPPFHGITRAVRLARSPLHAGARGSTHCARRGFWRCCRAAPGIRLTTIWQELSDGGPTDSSDASESTTLSKLEVYQLRDATWTMAFAPRREARACQLLLTFSVAKLTGSVAPDVATPTFWL